MIEDIPTAIAPKRNMAEIGPPRLNSPRRIGASIGGQCFHPLCITGEAIDLVEVEGLPEGIHFDNKSLALSGSTSLAGDHRIRVYARNVLGVLEDEVVLCVGNKLSLTPPMGWNSWNCWGRSVSEERIMHSVNALLDRGLNRFGWTGINIDDGWQGERGGTYGAIQPNEKFGNMSDFCSRLHAHGLRAGIYSSPWVTTYGRRRGSTADTPEGDWNLSTPVDDRGYDKRIHYIGKHSLTKQDALQWAEWGFDLLKYDWNPIDAKHAMIMLEDLKASGRDIILSLSNAAKAEDAQALLKAAHCVRTTGDIRDTWSLDAPWLGAEHGLIDIIKNHQKWREYNEPDCWGDPDMLVLGDVGWNEEPRANRMSRAEQRMHFGLWCLWSAPLLLGCPIERIDAFTLDLVTNTDLIEINQDVLGKQARMISIDEDRKVWIKLLSNGDFALGLGNFGAENKEIEYDFSSLMSGRECVVKHVWTGEVREAVDSVIRTDVASHDLEVFRLSPCN